MKEKRERLERIEEGKRGIGYSVTRLTACWVELLLQSFAFSQTLVGSFLFLID